MAEAANNNNVHTAILSEVTDECSTFFEMTIGASPSEMTNCSASLSKITDKGVSPFEMIEKGESSTDMIDEDVSPYEISVEDVFSLKMTNEGLYPFALTNEVVSSSEMPVTTNFDEKKLALSPVKSSTAFKDIKQEKLPEYTCKLEDNSQNGDATGIRSVAVIKRSQVEFPVTFRQLQSNTDIKTPPSNWLRGQFSVCLPNVTPKRSDFTSFIMGYQFPDCIGEVDIVSDAENIKKLLKMAYKPNTHLSMMVHRIGKTILLDEFDIYKYLLRNTQNEWEWLRKFFYDHVLSSVSRKEENVIFRPDKSRDVVQSKNLLSKFLYHSIEDNIELSTTQPSNEEDPVTVTAVASPTKDTSCELPLEDHLPESSVQPFTRNIIWNFEDVRMLLGTDIPIFGGRTHPCVTLRLKDMEKPINILTGIDYWLDNLMCNVPEVVMCYHLNGIVQKYELIKTEDLPHISDSLFSPELIRNIAHNILAFLKTKATKEGHTYWLFKGKDDDIVKLYDLTSLCDEENLEPSSKDSEKQSESDENPFTVPVAMLLYCVAKNMWNAKDAVEKITTIRSLLNKSLSLLNKDKYPKIFSHSHLILADLYLPQEIDPDAPRLFDVSEEELELTKVERVKRELTSGPKKGGKRAKSGKTVPDSNSVHLDTLCRHHGSKGSKSKQKISDPPRLSSNIYERCNLAIKHVISALKFLSLCPKETKPTTVPGKTNIAEEPRRAKPYEPIPMPYEPLHKTPAIATDEKESDNDPSLTVLKNKEVGEKRKSSKKKMRDAASSSKLDNTIVPKHVLAGATLNIHLKDVSWVDQMRFKFLRKASLIYMTKGRVELNCSNYGSCLRYAKLSLRTWCGMMSILNSEMEFPLPSQPLLLAGDVYYNLSKQWDQAPQHIEDFNFLSEEYQDINDVLEKIIPSEDYRWTIKAPSDCVDAMMLSYRCFEIATKNTNCKPDMELKRRLACICNELGCMYMNQADQLCQSLQIGINGGGNLWEESWSSIEKAFDIFQEVEDTENLALLYCNKGRYLRLYAYHSSSDNEALSSSTSKIYERAIGQYEHALEVLNAKSNADPQVKESVVWEFSSTLLGYATMIQDENKTGTEEHSSNLTTLYNKCLQLCLNESKSSSSKEPLFEYRAAVIYIRLASIYHQKYRSNRDGKIMSVAELHYSKSADRFIRLDSSPADILKVHLDYVVLLEDHLEGTKNNLSKWKSYLSILKLLTDCLKGLALINKQKEERKSAEMVKVRKKKGKKDKRKEESEDEKEKIEEENTEETDVLTSLLDLLEKKLHFTLLTMLKITKSDHKSLNQHENDMKEMYSVSLNKSRKSPNLHLTEALTSILPYVLKIRNQYKMT